MHVEVLIGRSDGEGCNECRVCGTKETVRRGKREGQPTEGIF